MSRIGKQPVTLASGVTLTQDDLLITISGPKGNLQVTQLPGLTVSESEGQLVVTPADTTLSALYGLQRVLLFNAVHGVSQGWERTLELHGVGMRAALSSTGLTLNLGFSHPVNVTAPEGITFQVVKNVITVSGIDKQLVGETAASIRKLKKPEPYKGKGIRYSDEVVRRKAGKTGKTK